MSLPRSIQQQADDADRIQTELGAPPQSADPTPPEPVDTPPVEPVVTDEPTTQADPAPTPEPDPDPQLLQRYKSLKGKYDAEVPDLQRQLNARDARLRELEEQMRQLREQPAPQKPEPVKPQVDAKDVENFGADLVDMVTRAASAVFQSQAGPLTQRFEAMEASVKQLEQRMQGVNQVAAQTAEQQFYAALAAQVPDYEAVNVDEGWIEWLKEVDPIHGRNRQSALDDAAQQLNAGRVAAIFNAYKATKVQPPRQPRNEALNRQVAPPRSAPNAAPAAQDTRVWTQAEIHQAYADMRRGIVSGEAAVALERSIDAAVAEGRVR